MSNKLLKEINKRKDQSSNDILEKLDAYAARFLSGQQDDEHVDTGTESRNYQGTGKKSVRQKKKLRKIRRKALEDAAFQTTNEDYSESARFKPKKCKKEKFLEVMGLELPDLKKKPKDEDLKPLLQKSTYNVDEKVVVFRDLAKKKPKVEIIHSELLPTGCEEINDQDNEFNMKKARHEVLRFGISGFEKSNKEQANIALAIKLGAKPPKNLYKNYRELMEEKKRKNIKDKNEINSNTKGGLIRTVSSKKYKTRDKNKVAGFDSQIGHYKNGMQVVSKREIQKVIQGPKKRGKISAIKGL